MRGARRLGRAGVALGPLFALAACYGAIDAVPTMTTATRGLSVCWRAPDEGDDPRTTALRSALASRLASAGYVVVPTRCDMTLGYTTETMFRHGTFGYREINIVVRAAGDAFVDRMHLSFAQTEVPVDEPDRLAILMVNAVNASFKVAALRQKLHAVSGAEAAAESPSPLPALKGTSWGFCGTHTGVVFNEDGTVSSDNAGCGVSRWSQSGDHLLFDCNNFTVWDVSAKGSRLVGEWHRVKDADKLGNHGATCLEPR